MKGLGVVIVFGVPLSLLASGYALGADDSKVKAGMSRVGSGTEEIAKGN